MTKTPEEQQSGDKQPTQAMPTEGRKGASDDLAMAGAETGKSPMEGGPYPNPHTGKSEEDAKQGFGKHGGQTVVGYHGTGQLGAEKTRPEGAPNSATRGD